MIVNMALFVAVAVFGGLGSTWYMIERGSMLTTRTYGPWVVWTAAGRVDADPYTRAHFARRGTLPMSAAIALNYEARTDSSGRLLSPDCEYAIEGREPAATWWSLSVFDVSGRLVPNAAGRYAYNSATLMRGAGGQLKISLAPTPRPGNWLPTGGSERLVLVLHVQEPEPPSSANEVALPTIRRLECQ